MEQVEALRIFVRVAELTSFTAAAESLGLPKASVSTAVQQLENQLGTRLLHRTTRKVQVTQDGQVVFERSRDLLADIEELQSLFRGDQATLRGRLRVDMPVAVARNLIVPRLPEFMQRHPELEVELSCTDRRVDLVREGFDCVLRVGTLSDSSLIARPLGAYRMTNCASSAYLAKHGTPQTPADLASHRLIHYVSTLGVRSSGFEYVDTTDAGGAAQVQYVAMRGALTVNNTEAYVGACLGGLGIIQVPEAGMRRFVESGQLVEILSDYRAAPMPVSLLYPNRRHLPRRVQVFMSWMEEIVRPWLGPQPSSQAT